MNTIVINLERRKDRLAAFNAAWPGLRYEVMPACDASDDSIWRFRPRWWRSSRGAFGCLMSHTILLQCARASQSPTLILEDDAVPVGDARDAIDEIEATVDAMRYFAPDWRVLYLGGELLKADTFPPKLVAPGVVACREINRMHAYVVTPQGAAQMLEHLTKLSQPWACRHHCDHRVGELHRSGELVAYAPGRWLVQQSAGRSDISGDKRRKTTNYADPVDKLFSKGMYK